jgi:hypothetical protein
MYINKEGSHRKLSHTNSSCRKDDLDRIGRISDAQICACRFEETTEGASPFWIGLLLIISSSEEAVAM